MTELDFYKDQYQTESAAAIVSMEQKKDICLVQLDRTIFYPEGGGQPADKGWINDIPVLHVEKRDGEVIHHLPQRPSGTQAVCRIDWDHRFDYMQQHTGQHILSGVMYRDFGYNTVAVHQGDAFTTIEIDSNSIPEEVIESIEDRSMEILRRNLSVETRWIKDQQVEDYDLRRKPKVSGDIRIVFIEDYDAVACGGVHTKTTGEVEMIKHVQTEKIRGRVRLYWKIGRRAYEDYRLKNRITTALVERFSAQVPDLLERIQSGMEELIALRRRAGLLESRLAESTALRVLEEGKKISVGRISVNLISLELQGEGKDFLKNLAGGLPQDVPWAFCSVNHLEGSFQWLIAVSEGLSFDFNSRRQVLMEPIGGKGGGRPPVWQGLGTKPEGINDFFQRFENALIT